MNIQNSRHNTPRKIKNINGSHTTDRYVEFNPFPQIPNTKMLKFFVFECHTFFDGLIGYESLQKIKGNIITTSNELHFPSGTVKMLRKYPDSFSIKLNAYEQMVMKLPTPAETAISMSNILSLLLAILSYYQDCILQMRIQLL